MIFPQTQTTEYFTILCVEIHNLHLIMYADYVLVRLYIFQGLLRCFSNRTASVGSLLAPSRMTERLPGNTFEMMVYLIVDVDALGVF